MIKNIHYSLIFIALTSCTLKTPILTCRTDSPGVAYIVRKNPHYQSKENNNDSEHIIYVTVSGRCH